MDFVKKHYEKIILSLVLAGLVGALVFLPVVISTDKQKQEDMKNALINPRPTPIPDLDMSRQDNVIQRLQAGCQYDFNTTNKLFNPLKWVKQPDGQFYPVRPGHEIGADAVKVTKITPLYFIVTLDDVRTNEPNARYTIGTVNQAATTRYLQMKKQRDYVSMDDRKGKLLLFSLEKVVGPPEDPDQLILKLNDTGEEAPVSRAKPFQRVDGYDADLKYPPEKLTFSACRLNQTIMFGGDNYTIVDIKPDEVVLLAQSNQKKTTIRLTQP